METADAGIIAEFVVESQEGLANIEQQMLAIETSGLDGNVELVNAVFRTMHTIKGTAGFLGFTKLQAVGHASESLLSRLRAGELLFNADIATALLGVVDAIRSMLASIEQTTVELWREVMDTNLTGPFLCTRAALPLMRAGATIINNLSVAAKTVFPTSPLTIPPSTARWGSRCRCAKN